MSIPTPPNFSQDLRASLSETQPKESSLAVASLITGILSWFLIPIFGALAAIITGHLAFNEIRESRGMLTGKGMATAGLILGYTQLGFIVLILIAIIVALAFVPGIIQNLNIN